MLMIKMGLKPACLIEFPGGKIVYIKQTNLVNCLIHNLLGIKIVLN